MERLYRIVPVSCNLNTLIINNANIIPTKKILYFGNKRISVTIQHSKDLPDNEVCFSEDIISTLKIPTFCKYELIIQQNSILLGPYIGILVTSTEKPLERRLKDLNSYVKFYPKIGGVIVAFSLDQVSKQWIKQGFIYNPLIKNWEKSDNLSYPNALFNKCHVSPSKKWTFLSKHYGSKVFNYPTFHKWEMYQWLSEDPQLKDTLPFTKMCKSPNQILHFIKLFKKAYLKPIGGTFAKGIFVISKQGNNGVSIQYQQKKIVINSTFTNSIDFNHYFTRVLQSQPYLIQQAIPLLSHENKKIDFRLIYIKNQNGDWEEGGLFARYGKNDSGFCNLTSGGIPKDGHQTLKKLLTPALADRITKEMIHIANKVTNVLENHLTQCGNLGFDFGIDNKNKIWIIEINNEDPDHRIATTCKRKDILYYVRLQNMLYAKNLAGFLDHTSKR